MPGIAGIISKTGANVYDSEHASMVAVMQHESFYKCGTYSDDSLNVRLGWAVLPDSFCDCLPVVNERRDVALVFYGEHFTRASKRTPLGFRDARDLICLYEELGEGFLHELNGWFAGVVVDFRQSKVLLFNDRYGMQRLYYHETERALYFSSEAKSLLQAIPSLRQINPDSLAEHIALDCVLGDKSLFKGISLLPSGSCWTFGRGSRERTEKYFKPESLESAPVIRHEDVVDQLERTFVDILPRYLEASERVAISLTGGLDTRLIVAAAPDIRAFPAYTFAGNRDTFDVRQSRRVAEKAGLNYEVIRLGTDFFDQFPRLAEETIYISDGTFGVGGAHNLYLNRLARKVAPVRLTGLFGSEVVRQGRIFSPATRVNALFDDGFLSTIPPAEGRAITHRQGHPLTAALFRDIPWRGHGSMSIERSQVTLRSPFTDNDLTQLMYAIPGVARQSARVQQRLIENRSREIARILSNRGLASGRNPLALWVVQTALQVLFKADYWYFFDTPGWMLKSEPAIRLLKLPQLLLGYHKFEHYRVWYRDNLSDYLVDTLLDQRTLERPFFSRSGLRKAVDNHIAGKGNHRIELDVALSLELTMRTMIERNVPVPQARIDELISQTVPAAGLGTNRGA